MLVSRLTPSRLAIRPPATSPETRTCDARHHRSDEIPSAISHPHGFNAPKKFLFDMNCFDLLRWMQMQQKVVEFRSIF
uniref:Uncharacterized protein n=1 Tax=Panagrellus redivivus TaxID=6233 RepID=A0A7E4VC63_PANRE